METLTPQKFSSAGWFQGDCRKIKEFTKCDEKENVFVVQFRKYKIVLDYPEFHVTLPTTATVENFNKLLDIVNLDYFKLTQDVNIPADMADVDF